MTESVGKVYKKYRGDVDDMHCKASNIKIIGERVCKNNCSFYDNKKRKCLRGY